jgi:hypothetical protein
MGVSLAVTSEDVAWAIVLVLCVVMMFAPFAFWGIVMITRRNEQPIPEPSGVTVDAGDAR